MSLLGDLLEGLSRAWERATVRDERDRIAAARARAAYRVALAEQRAAQERERLRAVEEAEALYDAAQAERAAKSAEGREP